jgi:hypothetical protein
MMALLVAICFSFSILPSDKSHPGAALYPITITYAVAGSDSSPSQEHSRMLDFHYSIACGPYCDCRQGFVQIRLQDHRGFLRRDLETRRTMDFL